MTFQIDMINYSDVEGKALDCLIDSELYSINIEVNEKNDEYVRPRNTSYNCDVYSNDAKDEKKDIIQINYSYGLKYNKGIRIYTLSDGSNN